MSFPRAKESIDGREQGGEEKERKSQAGFLPNDLMLYLIMIVFFAKILQNFTKLLFHLKYIFSFQKLFFLLSFQDQSVFWGAWLIPHWGCYWLIWMPTHSFRFSSLYLALHSAPCIFPESKGTCLLPNSFPTQPNISLLVRPETPLEHSSLNIQKQPLVSEACLSYMCQTLLLGIFFFLLELNKKMLFL